MKGGSERGRSKRGKEDNRLRKRESRRRRE